MNVIVILHMHFMQGVEGMKGDMGDTGDPGARGLPGKKVRRIFACTCSLECVWGRNYVKGSTRCVF